MGSLLSVVTGLVAATYARDTARAYTRGSLPTHASNANVQSGAHGTAGGALPSQSRVSNAYSLAPSHLKVT
ncbi:MAG: hypothetical protein RL701_4567 [Pseudomonadota bacterium]|jgi:hypothetical protein